MDSGTREVYATAVARTIATMVDKLEEAKDALLELNIDDIRDPELPLVNMTFQISTLPSISLMADGLKSIVAASKSTEEDAVE